MDFQVKIVTEMEEYGFIAKIFNKTDDGPHRLTETLLTNTPREMQDYLEGVGYFNSIIQKAMGIYYE